MGWTQGLAGVALLAALAGASSAQPVLTSLGGAPSGVSNPQAGTYYISGNSSRWVLSGSSLSFTNIGVSGGGLISVDGAYQSCTVANNGQISGQAMTGISPAWSIPASTNTTVLPAANLIAARWTAATSTVAGIPGIPNDPAYHTAPAGGPNDFQCYGSGDSGNVHSPTAMSHNGRFVGLQSYISTYNGAGTSIVAASSFRWRGAIWDATTNATRMLPTPYRTSSSTTRRRDGTVWAVSDDGQVIVGAQEHNSSTASTMADPDGGRLVVWRWDPGSNNYVMSYLPNGVNASGFPITYSTSVGTVYMNSAGTIIVGPAVADDGTNYIGKWVWNAGSSSWDYPINLGSNLEADASWLPLAVTTCTINQPTAHPTLSVTGMSDDGNTVVGFATYSTCGSFMRGGWIWTASSGTIQDWYDYLHNQGVAGLEPGASSTWGPIGDNGDYTKGLPRLGNPTGISPDGSAIVGAQGGNQIIVGAQPWILEAAGSPCVTPAIQTSSTAMVNFSKCSRFVNLTIAARGTGVSFQWYRANGGAPLALTDGTTASGASITGSQTAAFSMINPAPADADHYYCVVTNSCGSAQSADSVVQVDPGVTLPTNDTCATATPVSEGVFSFNMCGAFVTDGQASCGSAELADLWWQYTPTFTGDARFQTCGSSFDSTLQLMSGCNGLVYDCNNDVGSRGLVGTTCSSTRSLISRFHVDAGVPILVRVGGLTTSATGSLSISQAPAAPVNDLCSNPTDVGLGATPFDLSEATDDFSVGVDYCGGGTQTASNRDVWFRLNAPCGGTFTIDTCGSTITNPMLHVMTDCSGNTLACNDNVGSGVTGCTSNQARISNLVITGPVLIRVSASGTSVPNSGVGVLNINGTLTPCCGSADFNCDGDLGTDLDIEAFFACLSGSCPAAPCTSSADFNHDGNVGTDQDIEAFFRVLAGGNC